MEEKPEFDLSSLEVEPEQGQAQNLAANPETQETAAEAHSQNLLPNTGTEKNPPCPCWIQYPCPSRTWMVDKKQEKK